jgi:hypothetical protein
VWHKTKNLHIFSFLAWCCAYKSPNKLEQCGLPTSLVPRPSASAEGNTLYARHLLKEKKKKNASKFKQKEKRKKKKAYLMLLQ